MGCANGVYLDNTTRTTKNMKLIQQAGSFLVERCLLHRSKCWKCRMRRLMSPCWRIQFLQQHALSLSLSLCAAIAILEYGVGLGRRPDIFIIFFLSFFVYARRGFGVRKRWGWGIIIRLGGTLNFMDDATYGIACCFSHLEKKTPQPFANWEEIFRLEI